ncbi:trypsin-like [Diorhabda sublineata]|uniref:trypsin-like n=1 Tax=Diorhabda sublineata TaxID=1163346 RepID=UPI0024E05AE4|nr:trypsin-like [Diorhabda sublineata]
MMNLYIFLTIIASTQAISGGTDTDINLYKSQLSLRYKDIHFCGASLINQNWALTAASCLDVHSTDLSVQGGTTNFASNSGVKVNVESFIIHPNYHRQTHEDDIALLHFTTSIQLNDNLRPAMLPFEDISDVTVNAEVALIGWGAMEPDGSYSDVLQRGEVSAVSRSECFLDFPNITLYMFCAGISNLEHISACAGDFGGQAIVDNCLKGIILWSDSCGKSPTVMTQISTYKKWILSASNITDYEICPLS